MKSEQAEQIAGHLRTLASRYLDEEIHMAKEKGIPADMGAAMRRAQAEAARLMGTRVGTLPTIPPVSTKDDKATKKN